MKRMKKIAVVMLSMVILVCCFSVQVSAVSVYDKAVKLSPMDLVSGNFRNTAEYFYKIVLSDSGKITFYCSDVEYTQFTLLDTNGNSIIKSEMFLSSSLNREYEIPKKGTYYLKLEKDEFEFYDNTAHFKNFYYGFKPDHDPAVSMALNVKVGDKLDFSALASKYTGKFTWKTTDSKVATVKNGTVTCKKSGKVKIRAYMENGDYAEITLVVKKK